jgi:hypothetical protein
MIRFGLLLVATTTAAMASTDALPAWMALRFVAGLASAWVLVFVSTWGFARPDVVFSGVGVGIAAAGLVCLMLIAGNASADAAWIALGAVSIAGTVLLWRVFELQTNEAASENSRPFRWSAEAVRVTTAYFAFGFGYIIPATFLPAMAREFLPDPLHFGLSWPVFGAAAAASTLLAAPLRKRFDDRRIWQAGHVAMAGGTAMLASEFVPALWRTLSCAFLVGGSFVVVTMCAIQHARKLAAPGSAPRFIAAITAAFAIGQIAGPVVVATTEDVLLSLALATALLLAGAILLHRPATQRH